MMAFSCESLTSALATALALESRLGRAMAPAQRQRMVEVTRKTVLDIEMRPSPIELGVLRIKNRSGATDAGVRKKGGRMGVEGSFETCKSREIGFRD